MRKLIIMMAVLLALLTFGVLYFTLSGSTARADTACPNTVSEFNLPDGSSLQLKLWGDEFVNGWETLDGYTVALNQGTGQWEYMVLDSSGNLSLSGVVVGAGSPPAGPHLRPSLDAVNKARAAKGAPAQGEVSALSAPAWAHGTVNTLIIMVNFQDVTCTFTAAQMNAHLFGGVATGPGDLKDYYNEISFGNLHLQAGPAGVFGPVTVAHNKAYYNQGPGSAQGLVQEAVQLADPTLDFGPYDIDGDGRVDNVCIVYAGGGPDNGCYSHAPNNLWPHTWSIPPLAVDGGARTVSTYDMVEELLCGNTIRTIGVFAHEFGHVLGLPDLYDTTSATEGVGHWCLMGSGSWTSNTPGIENGESPAHMSAWCKWFEGWITPTEFTGLVREVPLPNAENNPFALQYLANPGGPNDWPSGTGEYFLVENRQQVGFDRGLDGCGLLVWHIDEAKVSNTCQGHNAACHPLVGLEGADGVWPMYDRGDAGDPFPGTLHNYLFTDTSTPSSLLYNGSSSGFEMRVQSLDCSGTTGPMWVALGDTGLPFTTITLDPTPPNGCNGWYKSHVKVTLSAQDNPGGSGVFGTYYKLNNQGWTQYTGPFWVTDEGTNTLRVYSIDNVGNVEPVQSVTIKIDTIPPTTTIGLSGTQGCNGWYISPVTVTLTALDNPGGSGVFYTEYSTNGGATWATFIAPFNVPTQGTTTVLARSKDNACNLGPTTSVPFKIDSVPPQVNMVAPANGATIQGWFTFAATASDATSGMQQVRFWITQDDGSPWGSSIGYDNLAMTYNSATNHWEYTVNTNSPAFPDGCYLVFAHAEDNACNWSPNSAVKHFTIHNWVVTQMGSLPWPPVAGVNGNYKFLVKVAPSVDPRQPNVYSTGLVVKMFATRNPGNILQTSTYGPWPSLTNYWIDPLGVYHVEFKSSTTPMQYTVAVYSRCLSLIGQFTFTTMRFP